MSEKAKKGGFKNVPPVQLLDMAAAQGNYKHYNTPGATAARKEWFNHIKDDNDALKNITLDHFNAGIDIYGGPDTPDAKDFKKSIGNKRLDIIAQYEFSHGNATSVKEHLKDTMKKKQPSDFAAFNTQTWQNQDFKDALTEYLNDLQSKQPFVPPQGGKQAKLGGGERVQEMITRAVMNDPDKSEIIGSWTP